MTDREREYEPKIYLLPNLMTAGNLVCGFVAIVSIIKAIDVGGIAELELSKEYFIRAIWFILAGCLFDVLDGRLARLGGQESPFGREFDSIADIVSFGVAPALLVMSVILNEFSDRFSILVASVYLVCGGMRLARFNCISAKGALSSKNFKGFPIPAAAGLISSLTLFVLWAEGERDLIRWRHAFLALMLFLSFLMISSIPYPSFKKVTWNTHRPLPWMVGLIIIVLVTATNTEWMPALLFVAYLLYGLLVRPFISKRLRREIETEMMSYEGGPEEEEGSGSGGVTALGTDR